MILSGHAKMITERFQFKYPIIQAPMAGITTAEMVAQACEIGILGSLGAGMLEPSAIKSTVEKIRQLTNKPFNINLFIINDHPKHDWDKLDIEKLQKLHTSLNLPPLELLMCAEKTGGFNLVN
ncbi:nitronate monooxygenase [Acinetobacter genomosp. 15BJ]|uniref:Nitronate monooxygenase n=1 Tax=Acinetobacter genomosp. 15BJ TaxID=106651 RepID=A0ABT8V1N1_9GAMM|nr:nitronate monooxygenase [Acinetobacter genomosp. 15BJ]MDO3659218.1 nitronate monooxygenase [Acinetobacter genomosp. 15BJ]